MNPYKQAYYYVNIKRCLFKSFVIFIFQYLIIMSLPFTYLALPWYPPMGLAFVWFYLLGFDAVWGILLGGWVGYYLKGLPVPATLLYLSADILCGYWGAYLCQNSFASDIRIFRSFKEWIDFFKKCGLVCMVSAGLRSFAILKEADTLSPLMFFYYIDLCISDVNAILILSAFLFSWVPIPFTREKIGYKTIATALLFVLSGLYLSYIVAHQGSYLDKPGALLAMICCLIWVMCSVPITLRNDVN